MTVPKPNQGVSTNKNSPRKGKRNEPKKGGVPPIAGRQIPWFLVICVVVVVALIVGISLVLIPQYDKNNRASEMVPSASDPDPTHLIPGVVKKYYPAGLHVTSTQRVNYDQSPPFGGPHDASWAVCTGQVYTQAIRSENAVHSLEHGAVWIAYNPDLSSADKELLANKVDGKPYMMMSSYPPLPSDIAASIQSWGHQLKVKSASDPRIDEFITATRLNSHTNVYPENPKMTGYPEVGADCANPTFNINNPPPFDPTPPGPNAVQMDGKGGTTATNEKTSGN